MLVQFTRTVFFFFNDTATTEIYTLSLHDALPISCEFGLEGHSDADVGIHALCDAIYGALAEGDIGRHFPPDRKSTRLNSSHANISYAVFCLKKKKTEYVNTSMYRK